MCCSRLKVSLSTPCRTHSRSSGRAVRMWGLPQCSDGNASHEASVYAFGGLAAKLRDTLQELSVGEVTSVIMRSMVCVSFPASFPVKGRLQINSSLNAAQSRAQLDGILGRSIQLNSLKNPVLRKFTSQ